MLTQTFMLLWYSSMLMRIKNSGFDDKSLHIISDKWTSTPIITDSTIGPVSEKDTLTYVTVRPDGISACLLHHQKTVAAIIRLSNNETWGIIRDEWIERPALSFNPPTILSLPEQHELRFDGYVVQTSDEFLRSAINVLKGATLAYMRKSKINTEDICAIDLMASSINGSVVQWTNGKPFNYTQRIHADGVFISTTMSRPWFGIASKMRSPITQLALLLVAWLCLFLYPENTLTKAISKNGSIRLTTCTVFIILSLILRNAIEDNIRIATFDGEPFVSNNSIVLFTRFVATIYSNLWVHKRTTPLFQTSIASIASTVGAIALFVSKRHVSYPVIAIVQSLQMLVTLVVGRCLFKRHYKTYPHSIALAGAVVVCLTSKYSSPSDALTPMIAALLCIFLFMTAFFSQWQTYLYTKYKTPAVEMMWATNFCSTIFLGMLVFFSGELHDTIQFAIDHYTFALFMLSLVIPTIIEQWMIQLMLKQYGAPMYAMVITGSEGFALLGHSIFWKNGEHLQSVQIYIGLAFTVLVMHLVSTSHDSNRHYQSLPQKDLENDYDSMDEYTLESGSDGDTHKD